MMGILLRVAIALALLMQGAGAANAYAPTSIAQGSARQVLPERGSTIAVALAHGCRELPDLEGYFAQPSAQSAAQYFILRRMNNLACAVISGMLKVVRYVKPIKSGDGSLRCVLQVELFNARTGRQMAFLMGWEIYDKRALLHCLAD